MLAPVIFVPHGGGPLPVLGDAHHASMVTALKELSQELEKPKAIVVVTAHWEASAPTITGSESPDLIYDYYGFPKESYSLTYPVSGDLQLAQNIADLLLDLDKNTKIDEKRGLDHGVFIPLKILYPDADVPTVAVSLKKDLDPKFHIEMGKKLFTLREKGVMIVGSGMSFHNMSLFGLGMTQDPSNGFHDWLKNIVEDQALSLEEKEQQFIDWEQAPFARMCHPREEHLLPLHVCFGAGANSDSRIFFDDAILGQRCMGIVWG